MAGPWRDVPTFSSSLGNKMAAKTIVLLNKFPLYKTGQHEEGGSSHPPTSCQGDRCQTYTSCPLSLMREGKSFLEPSQNCSLFFLLTRTDHMFTPGSGTGPTFPRWWEITPEQNWYCFRMHLVLWSISSLLGAASPPAPRISICIANETQVSREQRKPLCGPARGILHASLTIGDSKSVSAPPSCGSAPLGLSLLISVFLLEWAFRDYQGEQSWVGKLAGNSSARLTHSLTQPLRATSLALFYLLIFSLMVSPGTPTFNITQKSLYAILLQTYTHPWREGCRLYFNAKIN